MISLVGYTGYVGSNIYTKAGSAITGLYNSKNIEDAFGTNPDLLIYSGMRAEKYLANNDPEADMKLVYEAQENIRKINPKKLVLISTIDVLKEPNGKDEDAFIDTDGLHAYGLNRYKLEQWVRSNYPDALIIRLPGLYGINIKKNFIYDYINVIPFMLKENKFNELCSINSVLKNYYSLQSNGFYKLGAVSVEEKTSLKTVFKELGFTALNFTDSRNVYQFYPLGRLWDDINIALGKGLLLFHPATAPLSAAEVYKHLTSNEFTNEISPSPFYYDYKTKYADFFGGKDGYLMTSDEVLTDIKKFVEEA